MRLALTPMGAAVMGGRRTFGLSDILAILGGVTNSIVTDPNDWAALSQTRYVWTPVTAVGQAVGLALDLSQGLALGADLKSTGAVGLTGTATAATYNTGTGAGTCVRVDASNQSWVSIGSLNALHTYKAPITNTGAVELSIRTATSAGTVLTTIAAGASADVYFNGNATCVVTASAAGTAAFTIAAFQHIAGNHFRAPNDGTERPVLAEISTGNYGLQGDGTGDFMSTPAVNWTGSSSVTFIQALLRVNDATSAATLNHNNFVNPSFSLLSPRSAGVASEQAYAVGTASQVANTAVNAAPHLIVLAGRYSQSPNALNVKSNADAQVDDASPDAAVTAFANAPVTIMARNNGLSQSNAVIGRTFAAPIYVSDAQRDSLMGWINAKTGAY
jgi:hypothetical protein